MIQKKEKKYLATVSVLVNNRELNSIKVNQVLTDYSYLIMARLGVNPQRNCLADCLGVIILAVEGTAKEINDLTKKLGKLSGATAKSIILKK